MFIWSGINTNSKREEYCSQRDCICRWISTLRWLGPDEGRAPASSELSELALSMYYRVRSTTAAINDIRGGSRLVRKAPGDGSARLAGATNYELRGTAD